MVRKLVLLLGLCLGAPLRGMIQEKRIIQDDEVVVILCEGKELTLDKRLAKLSEVLKSGVEDAGTNGSFSLPSVISLSTWAVLQGLLERLSRCENDQEEAPQPQKEILEVLKGLDAPTLIKLLVAVDCLDISCLLPSALCAASEIDVLTLSVEELEMVPLYMRGPLVLQHVVNQLGPLSGKVIATYEGKEDDRFLEDLIDNACAKKSQYIWTSGLNGTFSLFECSPHGKKLLSVCTGPKDSKIIPVKMSPYQRCFSTLPDGTFILWERKHTELVELVEFKGHANEVTSVCWMKEGQIASGSTDGTVRVWDSTTGEQRIVCKGNDNKVCEVCVLSHDYLAAGYTDGTLRIWDVAEGRLLAVCEEVSPFPFKEGVSVAVDDGKPISKGLFRMPDRWSQPGSWAVFGGFSFSRATRVWDVSLLKRLKNAHEGHIQEVWLYLQDVARQKKLGTFNESASWDTIAHILDGTDPSVASRTYGYVRSRLGSLLNWWAK